MPSRKIWLRRKNEPPAVTAVVPPIHPHSGPRRVTWPAFFQANSLYHGCPGPFSLPALLPGKEGGLESLKAVMRISPDFAKPIPKWGFATFLGMEPPHLNKNTIISSYFNISIDQEVRLCNFIGNSKELHNSSPL